MAESRTQTPMVGMQELGKLLLQHFDIHDGYWMVQVHFGLGVLNLGPDASKVVPTGLVGVQGVGLAPISKLEPPALALDAAVVNPKPRVTA